MALNGSVSLTGNGSVNFYGWYGTLAIDDAPGFSSTTPIYNFMPGDTIDLKNVPFVSSASSYSFSLWLERRAERSQDHGGRANLQLECRVVL